MRPAKSLKKSKKAGKEKKKKKKLSKRDTQVPVWVNAAEISGDDWNGFDLDSASED